MNAPDILLPQRAPARADQPLLQVRKLHIPLPRGGDRPHAVQDLSYAIWPREILCIVGESGSGKSMSANAIMGLLPAHLQPSQGEILFGGRDLLRLPERALRTLRGREIGMIFQEPLSALNPLRPVGDQIAEVMRVHGVGTEASREQRVLELLSVVGLPDPAQLRQAWPFRLSGGQRQRVMIAMALALEPQLLIADEPTTALDVTTQAQILQLIARIQRDKGMGVMFITHDFGVVAEIADRVAVMEKGLLVEQGPAQQILQRPQHPYTRRLIGAVPSHRAAERAPATAASTPGEAPLLAVRGLRKTCVSGSRFFKTRREVKAVDGGQLVFDGQDLAPLPEARFRPWRQHLQMIFQDPYASLNPRHTVGRILCDGPLAAGVPRAQAEARARELLQLVGLEASAFDRWPGAFSGGQRQRIGIARALAMQPRLIVADEAVSALDVSVQAQVLQLLGQVQRRLRLALIFITHDLRVAAQLCDRLLVMHRGQVVEEGTPAQIFNRPAHPYTQQLVAAVPGQSWDPAQALAQP